MALTGKGGVGGRRRPEQVTQVVLKQLVGRALGAPHRLQLAVRELSRSRRPAPLLEGEGQQPQDWAARVGRGPGTRSCLPGHGRWWGRGAAVSLGAAFVELERLRAVAGPREGPAGLCGGGPRLLRGRLGGARGWAGAGGEVTSRQGRPGPPGRQEPTQGCQVPGRGRDGRGEKARAGLQGGAGETQSQGQGTAAWVARGLSGAAGGRPDVASEALHEVRGCASTSPTDGGDTAQKHPRGRRRRLWGCGAELTGGPGG